MPAIKTVGIYVKATPPCRDVFQEKQDKRLDSVEPDCPGHKKGRPEAAFFEQGGEADGARTRDLQRDRLAL